MKCRSFLAYEIDRNSEIVSCLPAGDRLGCEVVVCVAVRGGWMGLRDKTTIFAGWIRLCHGRPSEEFPLQAGCDVGRLVCRFDGAHVGYVHIAERILALSWPTRFIPQVDGCVPPPCVMYD